METNLMPAGTISENACIGDYYQCTKFHACIKKNTIHLKFRAMLQDYFEYNLKLFWSWFGYLQMKGGRFFFKKCSVL